MSEETSNPVPAGWSITRLSQAVPIAQYGISSSLNETDGTPVLRMNNLNGGNIDVRSLKFSNSPEVERTLLQMNDVLFNRTNSIEHVGRTSLWRGELPRASFASYLVRLIPDQQQLDPEFLVRWLNLPQIQLAIRCYATPGVHQVNINPTNLRRIEICLPNSLRQQRKIARILTTLDNVIAQTEALIAKYQAIKQGLMHDLFTRGVDATGKLRPPQSEAPELYKQSDLGWIPKEWEVGALRDYVGLLKSGLSRRIVDHDIGVPVVTSTNIIDGRFVPAPLSYWYADDPQGANISAFVLDDEDILVSFINSLAQIGKLCLFMAIGRPCIYTTNIFRIKASANTTQHFLYRLLSSGLVQRQIKAITKPAVNQASFTTVEFIRIKVPLISPCEQRRITHYLNHIDSFLETEEKMLEKSRATKTGLMQDLLTGKVPVKADEPEEVTA